MIRGALFLLTKAASSPELPVVSAISFKELCGNILTELSEINPLHEEVSNHYIIDNHRI
jgi:hypothetical protein